MKRKTLVLGEHTLTMKELQVARHRAETRRKAISDRRDYLAGVRTEITTAWMRFEESTVAGRWRADNPGEYSKIKDYYASATAKAPTGIESDFGLAMLALVNAGKYGDGTFPE